MMHKNRIEQLLWMVGCGSYVVAVVTGAIIALEYQPSSAPVTRRLFVAETVVTDLTGDTLVRQGEWVMLDSVPPHHGLLVPVADSAVQWNAALVSHAQIARQPYGALLIAIHQTAASALIAAVAGIAALVVAGGYRLGSRSAVWLPLLLLVLMTTWIGTTLPADRRAADAYAIGRSLLTENIPVIGDVLAPILTPDADISRRFVLHAIWSASLFGLLMWVYKPADACCRLRGISLGAVVPAVLGLSVGLFSPPALVHQQSQPHWSLGAAYAMLHRLPMDATMLVCVLWWGGAFAAGISAHRWIRYVGAALVLGWFVVGAVTTIVG